ncbi:class C sortase [Ruminococcus sp.]|uniref:class C sortase n=1 Tax=Ruminococcus sp. TaxID=41978 RepID=UPI0025FC7EA8|nr:class C sortase [Ruminococcus sp.]MDD7556177.1 class C sortase [Ruminococcus sp.]MDY4964215.1 class C sortase [Ruminococcus callidus]
MRKKASIISTIVFIIILLVGLSVMLYPIVSDWWNSKAQSLAVSSYNASVAQLDNGETERLFAEAQAYNRKIAGINSPFINYDSVPGYEDILNISETGIMGYISIPVIKVEFPIYHGTSAEVLNVAAGHLQGSSLPVGGIDTHAVISAHRGLPSAKLFTDLDKLVVGDTFTINVLDRILTYEVEEILIVKPEEVDKLAIVPEKDYVTLMTCTPYGVNTHRLLLRSHRIETVYSHDVKVVADAVQVDPMLVVPLLSAPLVIGLIGFWIFGEKKRKRIVPNRDMVSKLLEKKEGD